jgi:flagellar protein FlbD
MIKLTRINDSLIVVNADLVEVIEANPDTIISLTTGHKFLVKDSVDEVIDKIKSYKRSVLS